VVSNALRSIGYDIVNDPNMITNQDLPLKTRNGLLSEFINQRIFERARDKTGKEPLRIAERLSKEISERLRGLRSVDSSILFMEFIIMIHECKRRHIDVP